MPGKTLRFFHAMTLCTQGRKVLKDFSRLRKQEEKEGIETISGELRQLGSCGGRGDLRRRQSVSCFLLLPLPLDPPGRTPVMGAEDQNSRGGWERGGRSESETDRLLVQDPPDGASRVNFSQAPRSVENLLRNLTRRVSRSREGEGRKR
eukprot:763122-Hanusia_phi.AAC.3